jgi:hypothetical protein
MGVFVPPYATEPMHASLHALRLGVPSRRAEFGLVSREPELWNPAASQFVGWLRQIASAGERS